MSEPDAAVGMDRDLRDEWVRMLRSGEYKQGFGRLRNEFDEFCCLGVLADIIDPEGWDSHGAWRVRNFSHLPYDVLPPQDQESVLPLNDARGLSFSQIADYIESNL